jgi:hypothetical protein
MMIKQYTITNLAWIFIVVIFATFIGCGEEDKKGVDKQTKVSSDVNKEASTNATKELEIEGFLTTQWCAEQGMFRDCRMESIVCGEGECYKKWEFGDKEKMQLVLYVHNDMKAYKIQPSGEFHVAEFLETSINRNAVTVKGNFDEHSNILYATSFEAPPPPKKSFFKGCL